MLPWKRQVLVKLWAGPNDLVTVGAFLCLRQLIHCNPQSLEAIVKVIKNIIYLETVEILNFS